MTSLLTINNVKINVEVQGTRTSGPTVVLLHGFTGSTSSWHSLAAALTPSYKVVMIDALGHGKSEAPTDPARYSLPNVAADFVAILDALELDQVALLGYSMGGRMALHIATVASDRLHSLILESASPGLAIEQERTARQHSDEALACHLETAGLEAFVNYWESIPLFASQRNLPVEVQTEQRQQRFQNNPQGLAQSLRGAGTGMQTGLWDKLPTLKVPTLLITGELDTKYVEIGRQMSERLLQAKLEVVPGCGHAVHLENPELFASLVLNFLKNYN